MSNAAIYVHTNAYDTAGPRLLGRHSAGESFLRGFIRHADVDRYWLYNVMSAPQAALDRLVERIEATKKPVTWIGGDNRPALAEPGVLYIPSPEVGAEAWSRASHGSRSYAICGLTHTTATATVMRVLPDLLIAPVEDYDALICTSSAVRESVETQLSLMRDYMAREYGQRRRPEPTRVTIPLGVNAADFAVSPADRKAWRERLGIPDDAIVALYVGRFEVRTKMNPALMAMALERAARRTGKTVWWVNSGWGETAQAEAHYHEEAAKLCPSVEYRHVDGRKPEVRFSIWAVADLFISFSDNIQETFGLTPVEAMAAGLPSVVSDWDGYKDTVRDGLDGFRVPTLAPRPGQGWDFAHAFANHWMSYENYVGGAAQYTAVDMAAAETALARLIEDPDLRRTLGANAQARAREVFDWAAIVPQYQALWAEQEARRRAAKPERARRDNPYRPDPYALFANYPTRHIQRTDAVELVSGMDWAAAKARLDAPLAVYSRFNRPGPGYVQTILGELANGPRSVAEVLERFPEPHRDFVERGLVWLARHDVISIRPAQA